jgi:hypothetical protein
MAAVMHETVPTKLLEVNGIRYAYRRYGNSKDTVPLVCLQCFRGTTDYSDLSLTSRLEDGRETILLDSL